MGYVTLKFGFVLLKDKCYVGARNNSTELWTGLRFIFSILKLQSNLIKVSKDFETLIKVDRAPRHLQTVKDSFVSFASDIN